MTEVRSKNARKHGRPLLASNAALSWFTERASMEDRYSRWTDHGKENFLEALTHARRKHRYFAIGFPHPCNNISNDMWSTFSEGHEAHHWKGSTDAAMEEGFQPLEMQVQSARGPRTTALPGKGSTSASIKASSRGGGEAPSCIKRGGGSNISKASTQSGIESKLSGSPMSEPSKASSQCSYVKHLDALRRVQPRPAVAGPVRKLDWVMFSAAAVRDFDFETTGKRAIYPTVIPGAKPLAQQNAAKKKKEEE
eukprot:symbB.v1.2.017481.t1/scaffold1363.1/size124464/7